MSKWAREAVKATLALLAIKRGGQSKKGMILMDGRISPETELVLARMLYEKHDLGHLLQTVHLDDKMLPETVNLVAKACTHSSSFTTAMRLLEEVIAPRLERGEGTPYYEAILKCA